MATADQLLEQIFSWIEQRERFAEQLKKLAGELESLWGKRDEYVGSLLPVKGAACLIGACVATFFTFGAAAPLLAELGAASVGHTMLLPTKLIEHLKSSNTMKEAQKIEEKSNEIGETIQQLFQKLKAEKEEVSSFADPDELDQHVMTETLRAMARRNGLKQQIDISVPGDGDPRVFFDGSLNQSSFNSELMIAFTGILVFFSFQATGKIFKRLFAKGAEDLITKVSSTGFNSSHKGGSMVVGGAVGMAFALPEEINSWTEMIKKNHVTEMSQSLRDIADAMLKITQTLMKQFDNIKEEWWDQNEQTGSGEQGGDDQGDEERDEEEEESDEEEEESDEEEEESDEEEEESDEEEEESDSEAEIEEVTEDVSGGMVIERIKPKDNKENKKKFKANQIPPGSMKGGLLNVRSLKKTNKKSKRKVREEVKELITENKLDVFLPTETWLKKKGGRKVLREASPEGFRFFHKVRPTRKTTNVKRKKKSRGGGVAIQYSPVLEGKKVTLQNTPETFEYIAAKLKHDEWDQPVLFINVYRPPGFTQFQQFLEEFQSLLDEVFKHYNNIIITGDFNIHVDDESRCTTAQFLQLLERNNLIQHVEGPTHARGHTLDLVITRDVDISKPEVRDDEISDHYTVYFTAKPKTEDTNQKDEENDDEEEKVREPEL